MGAFLNSGRDASLPGTSTEAPVLQLTITTPQLLIAAGSSIGAILAGVASVVWAARRKP